MRVLRIGIALVLLGGVFTPDVRAGENLNFEAHLEEIREPTFERGSFYKDSFHLCGFLTGLTALYGSCVCLTDLNGPLLAVGFTASTFIIPATIWGLDSYVWKPSYIQANSLSADWKRFWLHRRLPASLKPHWTRGVVLHLDNGNKELWRSFLESEEGRRWSQDFHSFVQRYYLSQLEEEIPQAPAIPFALRWARLLQLTRPLSDPERMELLKDAVNDRTEEIRFIATAWVGQNAPLPLTLELIARVPTAAIDILSQLRRFDVEPLLFAIARLEDLRVFHRALSEGYRGWFKGGRTDWVSFQARFFSELTSGLRSEFLKHFLKAARRQPKLLYEILESSLADEGAGGIVKIRRHLLNESVLEVLAELESIAKITPHAATTVEEILGYWEDAMIQSFRVLRLRGQDALTFPPMWAYANSRETPNTIDYGEFPPEFLDLESSTFLSELSRRYPHYNFSQVAEVIRDWPKIQSLLPLASERLARWLEQLWLNKFRAAVLPPPLPADPLASCVQDLSKNGLPLKRPIGSSRSSNDFREGLPER